MISEKRCHKERKRKRDNKPEKNENKKDPPEAAPSQGAELSKDQ